MTSSSMSKMAAPMSFDFATARESLKDAIHSTYTSADMAKMQQEFGRVVGSDSEKKLTLDQAFRDNLYTLIEEHHEVREYTKLVHLATLAVTAEICTPSTPFIMLSDLFDSTTLDKCSDIFTFVEDRVNTWKSDTFHAAGKNYLLRMCNDLLRRLSKSQNTLFCGRIQLFLARLFPLAEKSGLNLTSQFNVENLTYFNEKPEDYNSSRKQSIDSEKDEGMEIEEGEMEEKASSIPIDYNLYKKFWSLQDYFRKPTQCYEKFPWKNFTNCGDEVLACFDSYKLDDIKTCSKKFKEAQKASASHTYFSKYLTSEKLLDLQLSDSTFRRYVLVQFLVLFQYLNAPIKFKGQQQVVSEDQAAWVKKTTEKVYQLLRETPPDGQKFASAIEHILGREENWNSWKNEGCPSYVRDTSENVIKSSGSKKRSIGEDMKSSGGKLIKMGNAELTRLWNLNPDNMDACRSDTRAALPTLENFFEDAADQLDPEQMVEDEYKLVNDKNWSWKALRLLARRSPAFFAQSTPAGKTLPEFLTSTIQKLAKEIPGMSQSHHEGDVRTDVTADEDINEMPAAEENIDKPEEQSPENVSEMISSEQAEDLARELGPEWTKLALELNFGDDEIEYIKSSDPKSTPSEQAKRLLDLFMEQEAERATAATFTTALREIGQVAIAEKCFGSGKS